MKNYIAFILLLIGLNPIIGFAQLADPNITTIGVNPQQIRVGQTSILTFNLGNNGETGSIFPGESMYVQVGLPANKEVVPILVNGAYISDSKNYFTWTYDEPNNAINGTPRVEIPAGEGTILQVTLKGMATHSNLTLVVNIMIAEPAQFNDRPQNNAMDIEMVILEPLPVTLTHFTAKKEKNTSALTWSTADEVNSERFEVQRSFDNKVWHQLGEVAATGNSTLPQDYHFTDDSPANGSNYYRLKMIDRDGSFEISKQQSLVFEGLEGVSVFPNPTADLVNLKLDDARSVEKVVLQSVTGQVLYTATQDTQKAINIRHYPAGTYLVLVHRNDGRTTSHKIVKQ